MFGLFKKNSPGIALVKYANNIGFLYKNLKSVDSLGFEDATNKIRCLTVYYVKEIAENPIMDNLDVRLKCMIPEMYAFKFVTIAYSSTEILSLLHQIIEKYNLNSEFKEIIEKGDLYYKYENCYDN